MRHQLQQNRVVVFGVGGMGCRIASSMSTDPSRQSLRVGLVDREDETPNYNSLFDFICIPNVHLSSARSDLINATRDAELMLPEMDRFLDIQICVLLTGFGGGIGSAATPLLARYFFERGKIVIVCYTKPDRMTEGRKRCLTSEIAQKQMSDFVHLPLCMNPPSSFEGNILEKIEDAFQTSATQFLGMISQPAPPGMQSAAIHQILTNPHNCFFAGCRIDRKCPVSIGIDNLLGLPEIGLYRHRPASIILHIVGSNPTLKDLELLATSLTKRWGEEVDLIYGVSENGNAGSDVHMSILVSPLRHFKTLVSPIESRHPDTGKSAPEPHQKSIPDSDMKHRRMSR